ncbi:hypothetical protein E5676_scaffold306G002170 [Cucumis melo var. makuwa]|uniref:Uncharacterized protein n=1 Tax=Cucumis melo var. makuwa TaxID=1194695 RepID=A0A5A7TJ24_CUCMM|nr:hypothetical protein E6C27_scaffold67G004260 [Cucumis melo var. makuwa]TYK17922.1 hypothetical protein E5676_scaffold306G002170 [Cucumis melo var. makuwa]
MERNFDALEARISNLESVRNRNSISSAEFLPRTPVLKLRLKRVEALGFESENSLLEAIMI